MRPTHRKCPGPPQDLLPLFLFSGDLNRALADLAHRLGLSFLELGGQFRSGSVCMVWRWDERTLESGFTQPELERGERPGKLHALVWLEDEYVRSVLQIRSAWHELNITAWAC